MINYRRFLEDQIRIQREAIARWRRWFVSLILAGAAILVAGLLISETGVAGAETLKLAGTFVGVVAVFPYREIIPREERIVTYSLLLSGVRTYNTLTIDEQRRLFVLLDEAIKETLKR